VNFVTFEPKKSNTSRNIKFQKL